MTQSAVPLLRPVLLLQLFVFLVLGHSGALPDAWAAPGDIITIAGGGAGDGNSALSVPLAAQALTYDSSGNLYVADCYGNRVRKIDASGVISTVAGVGGPGFYGDGGPAVEAAMWCPSGVAVDASGNIFIADQSNNRIRKVSPSGTISTIAGTGTTGFSGDGGPATSAMMNRPYGMAVDGSGAVYFADYMNHRVRKVSNSGTISTVAGNGSTGFYGDGGSANLASLSSPIAVAVDSYGKIYIADTNNYRIRRVDAFGTITTFAGNGSYGYSGDNGLATSAALTFPQDVRVDASGNVYIADQSNNRIRKVSVSGIITTVAGTGSAGFSGDGGAATSAKLYSPRAVATDPSGNLAIGDSYNLRVRAVDGSGTITTIAGNGSSGFYGEGVPATEAAFSKPSGLTMDASGNLYISDYNNERIRKVDPDGIVTTFAGTGSAGWSPDGTPASAANVYGPRGLAIGTGGTLIYSEADLYWVRKVTATGFISTVAGSGASGYSGDNGPATSAKISYSGSVAVDAAGNLFISDMNNNRIRKVDPSGIITTIAGTGFAGFSGDGGPATAAMINSTLGITTDAAGNVYFSDRGNARIRKIDTSGIITTIAGTGTPGYSGDGGSATSAEIQMPDGIALDFAGNIYFSDAANQRVRKIDTNGIITTVAGNGVRSFAGDNGPAKSASLNYPSHLYLDPAGNIYISDDGNNRVRKVLTSLTSTGTVIINGGARSTNATAVSLTLTCPFENASCSQMQLSNDSVTWSGPEAFSAAKAWTLRNGDGEKWVFAKFSDDNGNLSSVQSGSIVLDTTPPAINITAPGTYSTSASPLLSFTLSDGTATVKVDGIVVNTVSGGYLDPLAEGSHTIRVEATDALGNVGSLGKTFIVDSVAPSVSVSSPAAGATYYAPPTLTYTVSDGTVTVKVDGSAVSKPSGSILAGLAEGAHNVRVESRDAAGNVGYVEVPFTIDLAPTVSISSPAASVPSSAPLLSYTVGNGSASNVAVVVKVDGVAVNKVSGDTLGPLAEGSHTVRVDATDAAGTGFAEKTFTVDTVAPVVAMTSPTAATFETQPLLGYTVSEGSVTVKVDGTVVSKVSGSRLATLSFGPHTVRVESRDAAGNVGYAQATFSVTGPVFSSEDFESNTMTNIPWYLSGSGIWLTRSVNKHGGLYAASAVGTGDSQSTSMDVNKNCLAGNISFWYSVSSDSYDYLIFYIDGIVKGRWSGMLPWTQVSYPVAAGQHTFRWTYSKSPSLAYGADSAYVDDISFPPTPTLPTVTISSPAAGVTGNNRPLLTYAVSDGTVKVKVDGVVVDKASGSTLDTLADGTHTVRVEAANAIGSGSAETTFIVDTITPSLGVNPVASPTAVNTQTITGTRETDATINISVNTAATVDLVSYPSATTWSCAVSNLADGANTFTVTATDAGSNTVSTTATIVVDTTPPQLSISSPQGGVINSRTPVVSYASTEGTPVVALDGIVVAKASGDTVGPLADGAHTVRVTAVDTAGNSGFAEVNFVVDATAPTVTITAPTAGTTNNPTPALAFSVSEGTAVVTVDGTVVPLSSGDSLDRLADGPHTVRVATSDAAGNAAYAELSFRVDTAAPAVTLSSPANGMTNNRKPVLQYSASEGTVVVKVDGNAVGKVSGDALDELADGLHVVRVEATDSAGNFGFAETSFTLDTAAPVVSITAPVAGPSNDTPQLIFSATDGAVVVKVDSVAVSKESGDTLDQLAPGVHTVRVEAADIAGNVGVAEVSFTVRSFTVTLQSGPNGSIAGPTTVPYGSQPTYTFTPDTGYHIVDVTVNGGSVGSPSTYAFPTGITADAVIAAEFAVDTFIIARTAGDNGSISGPASVNYRGSGTYAITPATGYHVADVLVDGASVGSIASYSFANVTAAHTISASFAINSYPVTATAGSNGSISGPDSVTYGATATCTITPATGYHVADVLVDGTSVGAVTSYSLTNVTSAHTISASFAIDSYPITAKAGSNGSISGPASVTYGGSATYTITPAAGYGVADVMVDGGSVGAVASYSFSSVSTNHTISATFAALPDLVATAVTAPSSVARGRSASVSSSISNKGGAAGSFTVSFYLSKDSVINTSDTPLGAVTLPSLGAGITSTVSGSFTVPTSIASGKYFVGVVVDSGSVVAETNETNNTKATAGTINVKQ